MFNRSMMSRSKATEDPNLIAPKFQYLSKFKSQIQEDHMFTTYPKFNLTAAAGMLLAIIATLMFGSDTAHAKRFYGACGGGTTVADFINGAKQHGVADDYAKKTGQTPGLDGSPTRIMRDNYVKVILIRAVTINNDTCKGGKMVPVGRKFLPKGTVLFVPAKDAPAKGEKGSVDFAGQANCGNGAHGDMDVKRPGKPAKKHPAKKQPKKKCPCKKRKPKKPVQPVQPTPVVPTCVNGAAFPVNSGIACQGNESDQDVKNDADQTTKCGDNAKDSCNTHISQVTYQTTYQYNNNCSVMTVNGSDGSQVVKYYNADKVEVNEQQYNQVCSSSTSTGGGTTTFTATANASAISSANATVSCPSGSASASASATASGVASGSGSATSTVSQEDADKKAKEAADASAKANAYAAAFANARAEATAKCSPKQDFGPSISFVSPPHVYVGGNQAIFFEASDPDGDAVSTPQVVASESTKQFAHVSSIVPVNIRFDGTPCPVKVSCFRGTIWGDQEGFVDLTATTTANGKTASYTGRVQVYRDEF